jgi:hypothetical protein
MLRLLLPARVGAIQLSGNIDEFLNGEGNWVQVGTEGNPANVTGFAFRALTTNGFVMVWNRPASYITSYVIERQDSAGGTWYQVAEVEGTTWTDPVRSTVYPISWRIKGKSRTGVLSADWTTLTLDSSTFGTTTPAASITIRNYTETSVHVAPPAGMTPSGLNLITRTKITVYATDVSTFQPIPDTIKNYYFDGTRDPSVYRIPTPKFTNFYDSINFEVSYEFGTGTFGAITLAGYIGSLSAQSTAITNELPDSTTSAKGIVQLAASGNTTSGRAVQANDSRLTVATNGGTGLVGLPNDSFQVLNGIGGWTLHNRVTRSGADVTTNYACVHVQTSGNAYGAALLLDSTSTTGGHLVSIASTGGSDGGAGGGAGRTLIYDNSIGATLAYWNSSGNMFVPGNLSVSGALSKGSGTFHIDHPLTDKESTHFLDHAFVESYGYLNLYDGLVRLVNGRARVDIDAACRMSKGTFEALNQRVWVSSCRNLEDGEGGFDRIRVTPIVNGEFEILCQNKSSNALVSWQVRGERKDKFIKTLPHVDKDGLMVCEYEKQAVSTDRIKELLATQEREAIDGETIGEKIELVEELIGTRGFPLHAKQTGKGAVPHRKVFIKPKGRDREK